MKNKLPHETIKHVVVLMLENRGFDHAMGWLYTPQDTGENAPRIVTRAGDRRPFLGLSMLSPQAFEALANPLPDHGGTALPARGARSPKTPSYNPGESFAHIMRQMWGDSGHDAEAWKDPAKRSARLAQLSANGTRAAPMNGYVLDYQLAVAHDLVEGLPNKVSGLIKSPGPVDLTEILDTYTPEQLPVLSGLARHYGVSDEWFCSVPSQTNTNRAFSMAGTSRGMVNNSFYDPFASTWNPAMGLLKHYSEKVSNSDALPVTTRSLFEVLQQFDYSWKVYWQSTWPPRGSTAGPYQYVRTMLPLLGAGCFDGNFVQFDAGNDKNAFFAAARDGDLPALSWIEPKWGGGPHWNHVLRAVGNDMHPVSDTTVAEDFVMNVYNALAASPAWPNTLLVVTFDENGGTYDHVVPPPAAASGNDRVPLPQPKTGEHHMDAQTRTQFGFDFAQYGVRVPTLLVSPHIAPRTVFRSPTEVPFDHTSLIATVLTLAGVDKRHWQLGKRVSKAPTFEHLLTPAQSPPRVANPSQALNARVRPDAAALHYNSEVLLEYIDHLWQAQPADKPAPLYLGASEQGSIASVGYYYPTLTGDRAKAVRFRLVPENGGDPVTPTILNMAVLRIVTTETAWVGFNLLCVGPVAPRVYYARTADAGAKWQVRILSSRDPRQQVQFDEPVFFVSRLQAAGQDPLQRLLPYPDDPRYLTTRAGEWALWRVVRSDRQGA